MDIVFFFANIYIPPRYCTSILYKAADTEIQHITNLSHSVLTGDVNAHSTLWHSYTANIYIPPQYCISILYKAADMDIQHITNLPHSVLIGDVNAHSTLWHSYTDDHIGQLIDVISNSDHIKLNTNTPTRVPNTTYNTHLYQISKRCLTHCTNGHCGQLNMHSNQTTYLSSPQSTYDMTTDYNKTSELLQTTRKPTGHNLPKTQSSFSLRPHTHQHTYCQ